jgi:hypothetical protein
MRAVRFHTVIGKEKVIRVPETYQLAPGEAEVIVLQAEENSRATTRPLQRAEVGHLFDRLLKDVEELGVDDLPEDLSENHDHYIHGKPKRRRRS